MIRTVLTLRVPRENVNAVVAYYAEQDTLARSLREAPGLSAELLVAEDGSGELIATAVWPDDAAYQVWLDNPWRIESAKELAAFLLGAGAVVGEGRRYRIVQSALPEAHAGDAAVTQK